MEYKVDLERASAADFVKPSASTRYAKTIYTLTALSSIVLGALIMALFYHWNEIQMIGNRRLEAQDVKEVIRLTDVLLIKHDENAAKIEKLLTMFEHKLQSETVTSEGSSHIESNLTFKKPKDNTDNEANESVAERKKAAKPVSSSEVQMGHRAGQDLTPSESLSGIKGSEEAKRHSDSASRDEKQSSESFQWQWSFPQSAWWKLSQHGFDYGTSNDNPVLSNEQE